METTCSCIIDIVNQSFDAVSWNSHTTACDRGSEPCDPENDEEGLGDGRPTCSITPKYPWKYSNKLFCFACKVNLLPLSHSSFRDPQSDVMSIKGVSLATKVNL